MWTLFKKVCLCFVIYHKYLFKCYFIIDIIVKLYGELLVNYMMALVMVINYCDINFFITQLLRRGLAIRHYAPDVSTPLLQFTRLYFLVTSFLRSFGIFAQEIHVKWKPGLLDTRYWRPETRYQRKFNCFLYDFVSTIFIYFFFFRLNYYSKIIYQK